jgi:hypothetical protein
MSLGLTIITLLFIHPYLYVLLHLSSLLDLVGVTALLNVDFLVPFKTDTTSKVVKVRILE